MHSMYKYSGAIIIIMNQFIHIFFKSIVYKNSVCKSTVFKSIVYKACLKFTHKIVSITLLRLPISFLIVTLLSPNVAISREQPTHSTGIINKNVSSIQLQHKLEKAIAVKKAETGPPKPESTAQLVIEAKFEAAGVFHKGSAPVRVEGKWGLIDTQGKWVLAPTFTDIGMYSVEGLLPVKVDDKYGYINYLGTPITDFKYDEVKSFSDGLAAVRVDDQWGYIHPDGKWYITPRFDDALSFQDGAAPVKLATGWGYVYRSNRWLSIPLYQQTYEFSEGYGVVKKNNLLGLVDADGNTTLKPSYGWAKPFANGVFAVATQARQWTFVDEMGDPVIDEIYQNASSFSEGLVSVKKKGKWGYINIKNEVIIPFEFDRAYDFNEGVAVVVQNGERFFIDKLGRALSESYEDIFKVSEGFASVKIKDKWGYVFISAQSVIGDENSSTL